MTHAANRWLVTGRVQGVGFRWFVARHAHACGLAGWVRNLPDGSVEVVARGHEAALAQLEAEIRAGPASATVERVEKLDIPHDTITSNMFEIR